MQVNQGTVNTKPKLQIEGEMSENTHIPSHHEHDNKRGGKDNLNKGGLPRRWHIVQAVH